MTYHWILCSEVNLARYVEQLILGAWSHREDSRDEKNHYYNSFCKPALVNKFCFFQIFCANKIVGFHIFFNLLLCFPYSDRTVYEIWCMPQAERYISHPLTGVIL